MTQCSNYETIRIIMKKTLQLGALFMGALALSFTLSTAGDKCKANTKEMKCAAGKCGNATKVAPKMKCAAGKCGAGMKEKIPKKDPQKG
jgi:uncharacterized low-complexity protein